MVAACTEVHLHDNIYQPISQLYCGLSQDIPSELREHRDDLKKCMYLNIIKKRLALRSLVIFIDPQPMSLKKKPIYAR